MSTFAEKVMRLKAIWRKQRHENELRDRDGVPTTEELIQQYHFDGFKKGKVDGPLEI